MFALALLFCAIVGSAGLDQAPNIIIIYADDLGWNDVSFHGSPQIPTPNIDALASSGIILNNYYGEYLCTPSRAALMTGMHPIRLGLQHFVIMYGEPSALPSEVTILPEHLKTLGYATHMVGKWHLGSMKKEYTPRFRGFDSFFGYYGAQLDYYDHTFLFDAGLPEAPVFFGRDLYNGTDLVEGVRGKYATQMFSGSAAEIIRNHPSGKPLFLYLSHLAVHSGNAYMPLQAPPEIVKKFRHVKDEKRRIYAAMVSALDDSVGEVFEALHERDMLMNSVLVFASDNGGETDARHFGHASNYPLRGKKHSLWEGGVRVPAVLWSPLLKLLEPRTSTQLMHATDWLPTLFAAAGGDVKILQDIDGHNMWDAFVSGSSSPRKELLHSIDPIAGMSAIRIGDMKLLSGDSPVDRTSARSNPWYGSTGVEDMDNPDSMDEWVYRNGCVVRNILEKMKLYLPKSADAWRQMSKIECGNEPTCNECDAFLTPCLFNITEDPCERNNLAALYPEVVLSMVEAIQEYEKIAVAPQNSGVDARADPRCHDFADVPWLDPEHISHCPFP